MQKAFWGILLVLVTGVSAASAIAQSRHLGHYIEYDKSPELLSDPAYILSLKLELLKRFPVCADGAKGIKIKREPSSVTTSATSSANSATARINIVATCLEK